MEVSMLASAGDALMIILEPYRLMMLFAGVLMGLALGIIPGVGGLVGLALMLPFTFTMDPYTAFAVLLGMKSVSATSDTIPAVLFGVPGTAGAQSTILDGHAMAKKGEAGRALSAAYMSSLIGGLAGAVLLALAIPILRPMVLHMGSPELLALTIFGVSMVAALSGSSPLRGLAMASFGIMVAMIGADPQTGTERWTLDSLYLWEGLPLVPATLGLFAIPEIADMAIKRMSIAKEGKYDVKSGMTLGIRDALNNWWLVLRCGGLGAGIGAIPGLGAAVVDWICYGHALQTVKGAKETFGSGDVRGVIAPESANNAVTAGSLVPTIAFGVPGSATMAILLGAFLIQGLDPGPDMLTTNLTLTYSMVWSVAIANILGAGLCLMFSGQFAKIATLRYTLITPTILIIVYIGAFQATRVWGDIYTLITFAVLGWTMKQLKWPRPPLILGFVLGGILERYLFISIERYGIEWLSRPIVIVLLGLATLSLLRPFLADVRNQGGFKRMVGQLNKPSFRSTDLFYIFFIGLIGVMLLQAVEWPFTAKIAPLIVGWFAIGTTVIGLVYQIFRRTSMQAGAGPELQSSSQSKMHMDTSTDYSELSPATIIRRAMFFFGWILAFTGSMAAIGIIPTIPLLVICYMRLEGRERWGMVLALAVFLTAFVYVVFDQLLAVPWPDTYLGTLFPQLGWLPSI